MQPPPIPSDRDRENDSAARGTPAMRRSLRSALTDDEHATKRDWGLHFMIFYGLVALGFGSFAMIAIARDPGSHALRANSERPATMSADPPARRLVRRFEN